MNGYLQIYDNTRFEEGLDKRIAVHRNSANVSTLSIRHSEMYDAGIYSCLIRLGNDVKEKKINLTMYGKVPRTQPR